MSAFEMRKESIEGQYNDVMNTINAAKKNGWKGTYVAAGKGSLYPEVAEMLINEGLDVLIRKNTENDFHSTNHVSWEFALEEGRIGTLTVLEESLEGTPTNCDFQEKIEGVKTEMQEKIKGVKTEVQDKVEDVKEKLEGARQRVEPGLKTAGKSFMQKVEPGLKKGLSAVGNLAQAAGEMFASYMEEGKEDAGKDENAEESKKED